MLPVACIVLSSAISLQGLRGAIIVGLLLAVRQTARNLPCRIRRDEAASGNEYGPNRVLKPDTIMSDFESGMLVLFCR